MAQAKVNLTRINENVNFKATNQNGQSMLIDGSENIGGVGNGVRPMEMLLMSLAGCSGIDVIMILKKMRQEIEDFDIDVQAEVQKLEDYKQYTDINLHFSLCGKIKEEKLVQAIEMSLEKYCSVAKALEKTSNITYSYQLTVGGA